MKRAKADRDQDFVGKVVVVTGAASGIGRATALAFAAQGADVHAADIDLEGATATCKEAEIAGGRAWGHRVDCTDYGDVATLADEVFEQHGRVDVLHNNAGITHTAPIEDTTLDDWQAVVSLNLWGTIHGIQAFLPRMLEQGGESHVINTASMAGLVGVPETAPYCASKFGVVGLSEALAAEVGPRGVYVTAICPGVVRTNLIRAGRVGGHYVAEQAALEKLWSRGGVSPERVAADVLDCVRKYRMIKPSPWWQVSPAWWLKRISPTLYRRGATRLQERLMPRLLGGARSRQ